MFDSKFFSFLFVFNYLLGDLGIWGGEGGTRVLLSLLGVGLSIGR